MRSAQLMSFYVPETDGHDDYLLSLALCNRAAVDAGSGQITATASIPPAPHYDDGRF